ncbi:MAG: ATP-binding cassette domain-containing protein [Candidatus Thiosymbion ectosymbiont of Robbea hypermnestra]|nr:ATP-binding cassette domain-containing protein [Candidatus Thiosymbion ectosymbiont of Robbea hypermnestra]
MKMIEVKNVWKTYNNHPQLGIKEWIVGGRARTEGRFSREWVLRDISFSIDAGRSLGIIGHNGTGKSTLLNLLLGTLNVDAGTITRRGKIGAMLELGSGFHPDLTGRENIFLNGSILGMRINEIHRVFDAIVDFSELGAAIDHPLRTYSSGMSARLAFAVLVHARSDVLLIDEVLAVGDASFQAKCSRYLHEYTEKGGTLVVVSHDLQTLNALCVDGICLHEGKLVESGTMDVVIDRYHRLSAGVS